MQFRRMIFFLLLCTCFAACGRMEPVEIEEGYRGKARLNPFLAAWRLLESRSWIVEERHGLTVLPPPDHVMVLSAGSDRSSLAAEELAAWIEEGGHAIYLLAGYDQFASDLDREVLEPIPEDKSRDENRKDGDSPGAREQEPEEDENEEPVYPLLESFDLRVAPRPQVTRICQLGNRRLSLEMPAGLGVRVPKELRRTSGIVRSVDRGPAGVLSLPVDKGRLTILGDAWIWRNRHIGKHEHATLFWEIMRLHGQPGGVWFLSDTGISFFGLLWSHGWMALMALGLFVISWLWRSIPRFGPLLPDPAPASRDFVGHLSQAGAFLWSRGGPETLVLPLRQGILQRAARARSDADPVALSEEQWETMSRTTGLPTERLRDALFGEVPRQRRRFVELMSTLQTIASSVS